MGNNQTQPKNTSAHPPHQQQQIITINHPRFSSIKVISLPTQDDQGIIQITIALPNQTQFNKWDKKIKQIGHFDYIFLPISQNFVKTQFCGSGGISTIRFQYYPYLLSDEIVNRCSMDGKFFQQPQLWYLIYSILLAGSTFHSKNLKIGDVRPENIFISPQGQVRIATQFTWPGQQTNYQKTLFQKQISYLSPEELRDIDYGKLDESGSLSQTESFSVGLTCLDAATLSNSKQLYLSNHKFNFTKLEERLKQLENSKNFSEPLILIIRGLCHVQNEKRASCRELAEWLEKYQESIIQLQTFSVEELPVSLQNLRIQKPKDSRVIRQTNTYVQSSNIQVPTGQSNVFIQSTSNQTTTVPSSNYSKITFSKAQQQQNIPPISQLSSAPHYVPQPKYQYFSQNQSYVLPTPVQSSYEKGYQQGGYLGQAVSNNSANNNVFSKYSNSRSGAPENSQSVNQNFAQLKPNLNLQQIDQQLNISRRMFPSS